MEQASAAPTGVYTGKILQGENVREQGNDAVLCPALNSRVGGVSFPYPRGGACAFNLALVRIFLEQAGLCYERANSTKTLTVIRVGAKLPYGAFEERIKLRRRHLGRHPPVFHRTRAPEFPRRGLAKNG